jgi:hypothetical protein
MSRRVVRLRLTGLAVVAIVAAAAALWAVTSRGASPGNAPDAGLQTGAAPWGPGDEGLAGRLAALDLPGQSDAAFHIHVILRIYVHGVAVPVPAQIGIDPLGRFIAPLHTHDATGIIHLEADRAYPFTLGQVFRVWGVRFDGRRLGGYVARGASRLRVYVEGRPIADPVHYVLRAHDHVVVAFGRSGEAPTTDRTPFPPGL